MNEPNWSNKIEEAGFKLTMENKVKVYIAYMQWSYCSNTFSYLDNVLEINNLPTSQKEIDDIKNKLCSDIERMSDIVLINMIILDKKIHCKWCKTLEVKENEK